MTQLNKVNKCNYNLKNPTQPKSLVGRVKSDPTDEQYAKISRFQAKRFRFC